MRSGALPAARGEPPRQIEVVEHAPHGACHAVGVARKVERQLGHERGAAQFRPGINVALDPFVGVIGVAPAEPGQHPPAVGLL